MSLKSGSVTYQAYRSDEWPSGAAERFSENGFPGVACSLREPVSGFSTHESVYDANITDESMRFAGYPLLSLVKAEAKIPAKYLAAECKLEEKALMQAEGRPFVRRQEKIEIKKAVTDRLITKTLPTITEIPFAMDAGTVYAETGSESKMDALAVSVRSAIGVTLVPLTPGCFLSTMGIDDRDIPGAMNLTDGPAPDMFGGMRGCEFLTFLLYSFDSGVGNVKVDGKVVSLMVEGPYSFKSLHGDGGSAVVKTGEDMSVKKYGEIRAAFESGKLLSGCRLTLAVDEQIWSATVDGMDFRFGGATLSKGDALSELERFEERMMRLTALTDAFYGLYRKFIKIRVLAKWSGVEAGMRKWVKEWQA